MTVSRLGRALSGPPRVIAFWIAFLTFEAACYVYGYLVIVIPCAMSRAYRERNHHRAWNRLIGAWGRSVSRINRTINGVTIEVEGAVPHGPCLVVANHQSTADIPVLFEVFREHNLKFVVKKQLLRGIPAVSHALREGGFGVVDFGAPHKTVRDLIAFAHSVGEWKGTPVIYPEGQRTLDGSIARFRETGIRLLVSETGLPVVPVVIDGLAAARTIWDFFTDLPGSRCRVRVLPAIPDDEAAADAAQLPRRLEAIMTGELTRMRGAREAVAS